LQPASAERRNAAIAAARKGMPRPAGVARVFMCISCRSRILAAHWMRTRAIAFRAQKYKARAE
jgi:hypothetical protein